MLFRTTTEREAQILFRSGLALVVAVAMAALLVAFTPSARDADSRTGLTIDTGYAGHGVARGTPVLLHGARVGEVTAVASRPEGGVRLQLRLQPGPTAGLTDTLTVDFRPANYFGVTGVNLVAGPPGGRALAAGMTLDVVPRGNHTMQALLSRLGEITGGVVTPQLVSVIDRATRYVDGLNPMLETVLLVADAIAAVQTVSTAQLVTNAAGVAMAAPAFADGLTDLADRLHHTGLDVDEAFFTDRFLATIKLASTGLFGAVGKLASSHVYELLPATRIVQTLTAPVPSLARADNISDTLVELRTRFERMYAGSPEQRALRMRILLDNLPGVADVGMMAGPP